MKTILAFGLAATLFSTPVLAAEVTNTTTTSTQTQVAVKAEPLSMVSASPAASAKITVLPKEVNITFNQSLNTGKAHLVYQGGPPSDLSSSVNGSTLTAKLPEGLAPGIYRVMWEASNATTAKTNGSYGFQYVTAEEPQAGAAPKVDTTTPAAATIETKTKTKTETKTEKKKNFLGF